MAHLRSEHPLNKPIQHFEGEFLVKQKNWFWQKWGKRYIVVINGRLLVYRNKEDYEECKDAEEEIPLEQAEIFEGTLSDPPKEYSVKSTCCIKVESYNLVITTQSVHELIARLQRIKSYWLRQYNSNSNREKVKPDKKNKKDSGDGFTIDIIRFNGDVTRLAVPKDVTCEELVKVILGPQESQHPLLSRAENLAQLLAVDKNGHDFKVKRNMDIYSLWKNGCSFFLSEHAHKPLVVFFPDGSFEVLQVLRFVTVSEVLRKVVVKTRLALLGIENAGLFFKTQDGTEELFAMDEKPLERLYNNNGEKNTQEGRFLMRNKFSPTSKFEVFNKELLGVRMAQQRGLDKVNALKEKEVLNTLRDYRFSKSTNKSEKSAPGKEEAREEINENSVTISLESGDQINTPGNGSAMSKNEELQLDQDGHIIYPPVMLDLEMNNTSISSALYDQNENNKDQFTIEETETDEQKRKNNMQEEDELTNSEKQNVAKEGVPHVINSCNMEEDVCEEEGLKTKEDYTRGKYVEEEYNNETSVEYESNSQSGSTNHSVADLNNDSKCDIASKLDGTAIQITENIKTKAMSSTEPPDPSSCRCSNTDRTEEKTQSTEPLKCNGVEGQDMPTTETATYVSPKATYSECKLDPNTEINMNIVGDGNSMQQSDLRDFKKVKLARCVSESLDEVATIEEFMDSLDTSPDKRDSLKAGSDDSNTTPDKRDSLMVGSDDPNTTPVEICNSSDKLASGSSGIASNEDVTVKEEIHTEEHQQLDLKNKSEPQNTTRRPKNAPPCSKCNALQCDWPFPVTKARSLEYVLRNCTKSHKANIETSEVDYICLSGVHLRNTNGEWNVVDESLMPNCDSEALPDDKSLGDICFDNQVAVAIKKYRVGKYRCMIYPSSQARGKGKWRVVLNTETAIKECDQKTEERSTHEGEICFEEHIDIKECVKDNMQNHDRPERLPPSTDDSPQLERSGEKHDILGDIMKKIPQQINNVLNTPPGRLRQVSSPKPIESFLPNDLKNLRHELVDPLKNAVDQIHGHFAAASDISDFRLLGDDYKAPSIGFILHVTFGKAFRNILSSGFRDRSMSFQFLFGRPISLNLWALMKAVCIEMDLQKVNSILLSVSNSPFAVTDKDKVGLMLTELLNNENEEGYERLLMTWFHKFRLANHIHKRFYHPHSLWCCQSDIGISQLIEELMAFIESVCSFPYKLHADFVMLHMKRKADKDAFSFERRNSDEYEEPFCFE